MVCALDACENYKLKVRWKMDECWSSSLLQISIEENTSSY